MKTLKQWELPNNSEVIDLYGNKIKFLKMDGMYAHWEDKNGEFAIGNFKKFQKLGAYYQAIE